MTSQISKYRFVAVIICLFSMLSLQAQGTRMHSLIGQSLAKVSQPTPSALLNCIAELKRIDSMYPDSIQPKYQMALQMLNYSVMNPQAKETEGLLAEAQQVINRMKELKGDEADIHTLQGFLYMDHIVRDPAVNGPRYYLQVMENYEKALQQNPDHALAKALQQKFMEGMKNR